MAIHKLINNFSGGEVTPYFDGRIDQQKYDSSCQTMENFRSLPWGGAQFRTGTNYVANTKANGITRLIPFVSTTAEQFILELGNSYMRFFQLVLGSWAPVLDSGSIYEIWTPWNTTQIFQVQFKQINDIILFTSKEYPEFMMQRLFTGVPFTPLAEYDVLWYPTDDENIDNTFTISASGTTVGSTVNLVSTKDVFTGHGTYGLWGGGTHKRGTYFYLRHPAPVGSVQLPLDTTGTSSNIIVGGGWRMVTSQNWYGTLLVQRSIDGGSTWETIRQIKSASDHNADVSGDESSTFPNGTVLLRLDYTNAGSAFAAPVWSGPAPTYYAIPQATLETTDSFLTGIVEIKVVTDAKHATAVVRKELASTAATFYWTKSSLNAVDGYARTIGLYEQRHFLAGSVAKPTTIWGSASGDFPNFRLGDKTDDAVSYQIAEAQYNPIYWLASIIRLHAGTSGMEHIISSGTADDPLSPTNISIKRQSTYGSVEQTPLLVDNAILFTQRNGTRIREMREMSIYANPSEFMCPDLTILAEHMFGSGIVQMDYARLPDPTVFAVNAIGELLVMNYNREQNIVAWSRYVTDGKFESVCCLYGSPDYVAVTVARIQSGGPTVRSIEVFAAYPTKGEATSGNLPFLDCMCGNYLFPFGGTVSGLTPLIGLNVTFIVNGVEHKNQVVTGDTFTIPPEWNAGTHPRIIAGVPYVGTLQPMKPDMVMQTGASIGRKRRVNTLIVRVKDTRGLKYGPDLAHMETLPFRDTSDLMDRPPPLKTKDFSLNWPGSNDRSGEIILQQTQPYPCTVLALNAELTVTED